MVPARAQVQISSLGTCALSASEKETSIALPAAFGIGSDGGS